MVLRKQLESPGSGDWGQVVLKNLEELEMQMNVSDIEKLSEESFRRIVKEKINVKALEYINQMKEGHTKVLHNTHLSLEMQSYLEANEQTVQEVQFLFAARSRMLDVRCNYRGKYFITLCPCCNTEEDNQEHLLYCHKLDDASTAVDVLPAYEDLFSSYLEKQIKISRILKAKYSKRNKMKNHFS